MKRLNCFSKRDYGGVILAGVGFAELIVSIALSFAQRINETTLLTGLAVCTCLFGIGYFAAYLSNARTRFRPSWYLPFGFFMMIISVIALIVHFFELRAPSVGLVSVAILLCVFNTVILFSTSLQLRALCLARWFAVAFFGVLNAVIAVVLYFDLLGLKSNPFACISVCLALFGIQTLAETFYNVLREKRSTAAE